MTSDYNARCSLAGWDFRATLLGHGLDLLWVVHLQRTSAHHLCREDQVRRENSVIGMQVRGEHYSESGGVDRFDLTRKHSLLSAPDHAGAEVDEIRCIFHDDRRRWPGTTRIDRRVARAEHHDERPVRARGLRALSRHRRAADCRAEQE
jgi:hypothetical protein